MSGAKTAIRVFVSFRRSDVGEEVALDVARAVRDRLPDAAVFVDQIGMKPGPFPAQLAEQLRACHVLLALMGPDWRGAAHAPEPRLDDPADWVRIELESVLRADKLVVPLLIDGTPLPAADTLPLPLRTLPLYQAYRVSRASFDRDMDRVTSALTALELSPTLRMRAAEDSAFAQLGDLVAALKHELIASAIDLEELTPLASTLHQRSESNTHAPLDAEGARVIDAAFKLVQLYARVPRPVYWYAMSQVHEAVTGRTAADEMEHAHRTRTADRYAFENAWRVLFSTRNLVAAGVDGYSNRYVIGSSQRLHVPRDARFAVVTAAPAGSLLVFTSSDGEAFEPLGRYRARAHPIGRARLRTAPEPKLYAHDARTVYRWSLDDPTPEAEWSIPDSDLAVTFSELFVFGDGPIEFLVGTGHRGRRWIKCVGRPDLVELDQPAAGTGASFAADRAGVLGVLTTDRDELIIERTASGGAVTRTTLDIEPAVRSCAALLMLDGTALAFIDRSAGPRINYADVTIDQGVCCALVDCTLQPFGEATLFVDATRGTLIRPPAVARSFRGRGRFVRLAGRSYFVRSTASEGRCALAWDVSNPLQVRPSVPAADWQLNAWGEETAVASSSTGEPLVLCSAFDAEGGRFFAVLRSDGDEPYFTRVWLRDAGQLYAAVALGSTRDKLV